MSENDSTHLGTTVEPSSTLMGGVANLTPLSTSSPELESDADTAQENYDQAIKDVPRERTGIKLPVRIIGISLLAVGIIVGVFLMLSSSKPQTADNSANLSDHYNATSVPLSPLSSQLNSKAVSSRTLTVNGSVVLGPSSTAPTNPTPGQLFYNQTNNQLGYYDGKGFVYLNGAVSTVANNYNTTNNITNLGAVTNITNVTNVTSITGSNLNATGGTAGDIAMFTSASTLGNSLINETASTLNVGNSGATTVNVGSGSNSASTTVQGGTAGLNINTGGTTGTSGNINIQSGDSSTTLAGNVSIDTGSSVIAGTIIADKTFEDGIDNMGDAVFGDNSTVIQSNAQAHSGTNSLAISVGSNFFPSWAVGDGATGPPPYSIPAIGGHTYAMTAWVRAGSNSDNISASVIWSNDGYAGGGEISQQVFGSVTDVSTTWRKVSGVLTAPAGTLAMGFIFNANDAQAVGEVHYFDDITLTDLSSSSSSSSINIGTNNAEMINIGNSGQLAATSIYGSSINLNGGGGILSESAATITDVSGGATYTTTSGALDITSATAATWKVSGSSANGQNLTIQAGNGGGGIGSIDPGGNLLLQGGNAVTNGDGGGVIVQPQTDSTNAFSIENAAGASLLSMDTATTIINDPYDTANAPSGTLEDSATWVNGQYVELNNGARTDGEVNYTPSEGNSFDATFQFNASGGADSTFFYAYNTSFPNNASVGIPLSATNGYIFNYNDFRGTVDLIFNGTVLASSPASGIGNGAWHSAEVIKNGDVLTMKLDGGTVLTYTDISRTLSGNNFGLGGYSGAFAGTHLVRHFVLTTGSSPGILTTNAFAQFNNSINVSGQAAAGSVLTPLVQTNELDSTSGTIALGANNTTDIQIGTGGATPTIPTIQGAAAIGNNLVGANLTIDAGNGTGVGGSGNINFYTAGGIADPLVTFDSTNGTSESGASNNAPLTWSHTTGAEGNMVLIVTVDTTMPTTPSANPPATATSVTYNGVALTELTSLTPNGDDAYGSVWYLTNPPSGANNVVVNFTGPASNNGVEATTFYNVDTTNPIASFTAQSAYTTTTSTTLTGTNAGEGVFDDVMSRGEWASSPTPGAGQTELYNAP